MNAFRFALLLAAVSPAAVAGAADDPRDVVRLHRDATGGADRLHKTPCIYMRAAFQTAGRYGPVAVEVELWSDHPTRFRQSTAADGGTFKRAKTDVIAGAGNWSRLDDDPARPMTEAEAGGHKTNAANLVAIHRTGALLDDPACKLTAAGRAEIDGRPAIGVTVSRPDHPDITLWFDAESHLLVKLGRKLADGKLHEQSFLDYKDFGGVMQPTRSVSYTDGQKGPELTVREYRFTDRFDPALFERPKE